MSEKNMKERIVESVVHFRTSFSYLYIFMLVIGLWIIINATGFVRWDNPEFTYLNIAISVLTELQSVILLIYVTRMEQYNRDQAAITEKKFRAMHLKLNEIVAAIDGASNKLINVEDMTKEEVNKLHEKYSKLAQKAKMDEKKGSSHSIEEEDDD